MINDIYCLFNKLKINKDFLQKNDKAHLDKFGYCVFNTSNFFSDNYIKLGKICDNLIMLEGWEGKEKFYEKNKKFENGADRLGNLIEKNLIFKELIKIPEILSSALHVINGDIKIAGLNLRSPKKGCGEQNIHIDGFPRKNEHDPFGGVVCFLYLDDSTIDNGAMRLIPKSHKLLGYPDEYLDVTKRSKFEKRIIVNAGTIVVANLNIWHAGATNFNGKTRKVIMLNIKSREYDQLLNYKKYLSNETKAQLSEEEKYLLAIRDCDKSQEVDSGGSANNAYRDFLSKNKINNYKELTL